MKKNAFTFAELMISLVVISVLCAILYPMIAQFTPNSNKPLFKAAYKTLVEVLSELTEDSITGELDMTQGALCTGFCTKANTLPRQTGGTESNPVFENAACATQCDDRILITTNGMRWHFGDNGDYTDPMDGATEISDVFRIYVDVNASNNSLASIDNCNSPLDISVNAEGKTTAVGEFCYASTTGDTGVYTTLPSVGDSYGVFDAQKLKAQDTFEILIDNRGRIVTMSPAGWANLEDNLQAVD